ncbi:recombinase RecT [Streptococcus cristatus]|uniref:recombinase RecT n=1 Tax=Streptococcus cristatus TaxID=45634 RepID=UPI0028D20A1F|nr:recombinase RecT [Streptococcus cristatus]
MTNELTHKQFFNSPAVKQKFSEVVNGNGQQFVASLLSIVTNNNLLAKATNESIMTAAMKAAVLNLPIEPSLGYAYIVPYKSQAQFQIGYKGLIQLAQRSGQVTRLNAGEVYESQYKGFNPLTEDLEVDMAAIPKENEKVVGYFAFMRLANGFEKTVFWTKERVQAHGKKYSQSFSSKYSPWQSDFDAMARKTVLKHMLSTYAPLSTELQEAIVADNEDSKISEVKETKDITPQEPENLSDLMSAPKEEQAKDVTPLEDDAQNSAADNVPDFVDPETGEIKASEENLFDNLEDLS